MKKRTLQEADDALGKFLRIISQLAITAGIVGITLWLVKFLNS